MKIMNLGKMKIMKDGGSDEYPNYRTKNRL